MEEYRAAYEASIREFHEEAVMDEVKFVARELCTQDPRWGKGDPDRIVTSLQGCEMERAAPGEYVMEKYYVPAWVNYARAAQTAIDAVRVWDAARQQ